jgi:hypothetical protein
VKTYSELFANNPPNIWTKEDAVSRSGNYSMTRNFGINITSSVTVG